MAEVLEQLTRDLTDRGKLIEAGWIGLRLLAYPPNAPQVQLDELRYAFFAGAQHLFASIMSIMEPDAEPTGNDMKRMGQIAAELREFIEVFELRHTPVKGRS